MDGSKKFDGHGCYKEFVSVVSNAMDISKRVIVVQPKTMSGIATMNIGGGRWEFIVGD